MELLHEIFDAVHEAQLDVIHAEMDTTSKGTEEHALYVARNDTKPMTREQRTVLRSAIQDLYRSHFQDGSSKYSVSVLPLRGETEESLLEKKQSSAAAHETSPINGPAKGPALDHPLSERTKAVAGGASPPGSPAKRNASPPSSPGSGGSKTSPSQLGGQCAGSLPAPLSLAASASDEAI